MSLFWLKTGESDESYEARVGKVVIGRISKKTTGIFRYKKTVYYAKSCLFHVADSCDEFNRNCKTVEEAKTFIETMFDNLVDQYRRPLIYTQA